MSLDFTFLGEVITFLLLVLFTMKFVWPHLLAAIETREKMVSDAEHQVSNAKVIINKAEQDAQKILLEARGSANQIVSDAEKYATQVKHEAQALAGKYISDAKVNAEIAIEQDRAMMQRELKSDVVKLVLSATESLLSSDISQDSRAKFLEKINLS